jgi:hypothetical protein
LLEDAGIPTFVVGLPGTEPYADYFDQFAATGCVPMQGGVHSYFAVPGGGGAADLTSVLTAIMSQPGPLYCE